MNLTRSALFVLVALGLALVTGCASAPLVKSADVPRGSEIGVISFRDCVITGQEDCIGSGKQAAEAFQEVFNQGGKFTSRLIARPTKADEPLSDADAAELARKNNVPYVINGEVDDFYSVAPMTFRSDRAATSVRVIRASDGQIITKYSQQGTAGSNFATPKGMVKGIATNLREGL